MVLDAGVLSLLFTPGQPELGQLLLQLVFADPKVASSLQLGIIIDKEPVDTDPINDPPVVRAA